MFILQAHGLKKFRQGAGLTQKELSDRMGYSSSQFISNIEMGKAGIPSDDIPALAKYLRIPTKDLANLKLLDTALKLSVDAKAPQLKKIAKQIADEEKSLKDIIQANDLAKLFAQSRKIC